MEEEPWMIVALPHHHLQGEWFGESMTPSWMGVSAIVGCWGWRSTAGNLDIQVQRVEERAVVIKVLVATRLEAVGGLLKSNQWFMEQLMSGRNMFGAWELWLKFFYVYHFSPDEVMIFLCRCYDGSFCIYIEVSSGSFSNALYQTRISSSCQNKPVFVGGAIQCDTWAFSISVWMIMLVLCGSEFRGIRMRIVLLM